MDGYMDGWVSLFASWAFHNLAAPSVIEKVCLTILSWDSPPFLPIKQLQNRKTNSGNRPQNVINFVKGWAVGPVTGYYYCRRKNPNQLQIPSCLVSVTVANYKWTLCYSFTSFAAQRTDSDQQRQNRKRREKGQNEIQEDEAVEQRKEKAPETKFASQTWRYMQSLSGEHGTWHG